jgi:hypothetical protein
MKRTFNIFDGLFLMALYFKLTKTGLVLCWPAVFLPYMVEGTLAMITAYSSLFNWPDRVKFWLYQFAVKMRVAKAGKQARKFMKAQEEAGRERARQTGGNPGRFIDPENTGK